MSERHAILSLLWSRHGGRRVVLRPGDVLRIGRDTEADVVVDDRELCRVHFELDWDGERAEIRDRSRHVGVRDGTRLDGLPTRQAWVRHGSCIEAGASRFLVHYEATTPPREPPDPALRAPRARALAALSAEPDLYAVLDASCDERIQVLLRESIDEHASLYEGHAGHVIADVAPYLVRFNPGSRLLDALITEGWGRSWGIFLTTPLGFREVRRHLRHFLMVLDESTDTRVYFRFYDPRVLRELAPILTDRQRAQLYGELTAFLMEGDDLEVLRFDAPENAEPIAAALVEADASSS
ncbi:Hypothetical protein A7982_05048 [Minicystis rosea]|nr:Hypothetical protein A7982_05048 [Minicystis rosea]